MSLSIDATLFQGDVMLKALEGEQVVRVSRKTIVETLKQQTATISMLFQDAVEKADLINKLEESNRNLTKLVYDLSDKLDGLSNTVEEQGVMVMEHEEILGSGKIEKLFLRVDVLEGQMAETERKLDDGFDEAASERSRIETDTVNKMREVKHLIDELKQDTEQLDTRANSLEERMQDLGYINKDGVFRIKAARVAVGANEVPVTDMFKSVRTDLNTASTELHTTMNEHQEILDNMAPNLKRLPDLIETSEANQKLFKDLGLAGDAPGQKGILQQFTEMKEDMTDVQKRLLEKCDITKMLETVELKYDEIVDHLQEAIQAAVEDEDQFKRVTEDLKEMCKNLMMNKADKVALIEVHERLNVTKAVQDELEDVKSIVEKKVDRSELQKAVARQGQRDKEEVLEAMSGMAHKLEKSMNKKVNHMAENMDNNSFGSGFGIGGSSMKRSSGRGVSANSGLSGNPAMRNAPNRSHTYGGGEPLTPETISRPRLGPGGPSLGGGFHVMLPIGDAKQRMKLPKVKSTPQLVTEDNPADGH